MSRFDAGAQPPAFEGFDHHFGSIAIDGFPDVLPESVLLGQEIRIGWHWRDQLVRRADRIVQAIPIRKAIADQILGNDTSSCGIGRRPSYRR